MHHRVFLPAAAPEIGEDRRHVRALQQQGEGVHDPGDARVDAGARRMPEQVAQQRRRVREGGGLAGEPPGLPVVQAARREQAVGRGLRLQVGELIRRQAGDQNLAIGAQQAVQRPRPSFLPENAPDAVAQQTRLGRHAPGQVARIGDRGHGGREERIEQAAQPVGGARLDRDPAPPVETPETHGLPPLAPRIAAELQMVGQEQVGQAVPVAFQLFPGLHAVQVGAEVLAFDVAQRDAAPLDDEVRRAAGDARRLVDGVDARAQGARAQDARAQILDQRLKRRPVAVLRRPPAGPQPPDVAAIGAKRARPVRGRHRPPPALPPGSAIAMPREPGNRRHAPPPAESIAHSCPYAPIHKDAPPVRGPPVAGGAGAA